MKILIVEDDYASRKLLTKFASEYGDCEIVVDGAEALEAFKAAWEVKDPYDLIFMDIMMPKVDGQNALKEIREYERTMGIKYAEEVKVIMTTALEDPKNVIQAFNEGGAQAYLVKPIEKEKLVEEMRKLELI